MVPPMLLNPSALWLLPLAAVVFFLARRIPHRQRRVVSSLHFWSPAEASDAHRLARRPRRRDWIALLQAAFLIAIVAGLSRPAIPPHRAGVVVVMDVSASMGARQAGGTRLEAGVAEALQRLRESPASFPARVIAAGSTPTDLGEFTTLAAVQGALAGLRPERGAAAFPDAVRTSNVLAPGTPLWVFSDAAAPSSLPSEMRWFRIGTAAPNVAVTALVARHNISSSNVTTVFSELSNFGGAPREATLVLRDRARELFRETVRLDARGARTLARDVAALDGPITASVASTDDSLDADDTRSASVSTPRKLAVRLTTPGNFFLERVLASNPDVELTTGTGTIDVEVCDGCTTAPSDGVPALLIPPAKERNALSPVAVRLHGHPLARDVDVVAIAPAAAHIDADGADVVMRAGGTPVLLAREERGRRVVTLNADLASTTFPLTTAFPVIVANALEWLAPAGEPAVTGNVATETESDLASPARVDIAASRELPTAALPPRDIAPLCLLGALLILGIEWRLSAGLHAGGHAWRLAISVCLMAATAGVRVPYGRGRAAVMFVLDKSGSIPLRVQRDALQRVNDMSRSMSRDDRLGLVTFGADAALDARPASRRELRDTVSSVSDSGTDIEGALALAQAALDSGEQRRIVLLTDGNETSGDAARQAARAATAHVKVDVVPLEAPAAAIAPVVQAVRAPEETRAGEMFRVSVELSGRPASRVAIGLAGEGRPRMEREVLLDAGGYGVAEFTDRRDAPGMYAYRAAISTTSGEEPAGGVVVTVIGPPQLLYVSNATSSTPLGSPLRAAGFVVSRATTADLPVDEQSLEPFDSVVLDDVAPAALTAAQAVALSRFVERRGGGLLLLGSARTLDAGGYADNALGSILPVDLRPRAGRRAPSMAFVLVFDKSGSMGDRTNGVTKIELARESALRVVSMLPSGDSLGIIAFDSQPHVVAPLATAQRREEVAGALRATDAGGSTSIGPAVAMAAGWVRASPAPKKHVLLISDGRTSDADAARLRDTALTNGFELSVIAIGTDADRALLESIATRSGGRAYFPDDIRQLPAIVARDASDASGGTVVNEPFRPQASVGHPVLGNIDTASLPALGGYVVGSTRAGAETILASHLDDPVLAAWRVGTGRVAMYTADLDGPWSGALRRWSGFTPLWMQTIRWLNRQSTSDLLYLRATETDEGFDVRIDAERGMEAAALANPRLAVRTPSGTTFEVIPHLAAPGRYDAHVAADDMGSYQFAVEATDATTNRDAHLVRGFFRSGERERAVLGVNHARLAAIANAAGGRILGPGDSPYRDARPFAWLDLRPACALLALVLFLIHLVSRTAWRRNRAVEAMREAA